MFIKSLGSNEKDALLRRPFFFLGLLVGLLLVVPLGLLSGCAEQQRDEALVIQGKTMGTSYHIKAYTDVRPGNHPLEKVLKEEVEAELQAIDLAMSTYRPDSELSQLNATEAGDECITLSNGLFEVIQASLQLGEKSSGYFDITVGPAVDAWGFGAREVVELPDRAELDQLRKQVGADALALDRQKRCLTKKAQRRIDLSAIAKGYAVDRLAGVFRAHGLKAFLVEVGGEVWAEGSKPKGHSWRIAIEAPVKHERRLHSALKIKDVGVASSGDYRNYYERDGQAYSHTIDPHSASPVQHSLVSVTVLTESTMLADGWATALLAMGRERALELAQQEGLAVLLIERIEGELKEYRSAAMAAYLGTWKE